MRQHWRTLHGQAATKKKKKLREGKGNILKTEEPERKGRAPFQTNITRGFLKYQARAIMLLSVERYAFADFTNRTNVGYMYAGMQHCNIFTVSSISRYNPGEANNKFITSW